MQKQLQQQLQQPKSLTKFSKEKLKQFLKTDRAILMICIGIAFVFWLITKLSYQYKDVVVIKVEYDAPPHKVFTYPPAQQLEVDIQGRGWDLLGLFFTGNRIITIPVAENDPSVISTTSLHSKVMKFAPEVDILNIYPENIYIQTENAATKKVPVVLEHQIRFAALHQFVDTIHIEPRFVEIKGPISVIKGIHQWKTKLFAPEKEVNKDIDIELELAAHSNSSVTCSTSKVRCFGAVEQVTEKEIEIPIEVLNAPDNLLLVILPKKIKVTCLVGLGSYDKVNTGQFKAIADFENVDLSRQKSVRVVVQEKPDFVKQIHFSPKKVDYFVKR